MNKFNLLDNTPSFSRYDNNRLCSDMGKAKVTKILPMYRCQNWAKSSTRQDAPPIIPMPLNPSAQLSAQKCSQPMAKRR
jgi:hypothetical protein